MIEEIVFRIIEPIQQYKKLIHNGYIRSRGSLYEQLGASYHDVTTIWALHDFIRFAIYIKQQLQY